MKTNAASGAPATELASHQHWVEKLAQQVLQRAKPPFVVTAGMTTSGPFHMGTLSEFLYPASVVRFLEKEGKVNFIFSADILDAFDAVPATHVKYEKELSPHLGKPLCDVPDPMGCCASFGDHFLNESLRLAAKFNIHPKVRRASDDYRGGVYDKYAKLFITKLALTKKVISETSLNLNLPENWAPLMPQCSNCGRIATTEISDIDDEKYKYSCSRKLEYVSGCGFSGGHKISDHKYKLQWRLHWPSWMDMNGTHIEGAGMDHHTRGGSWDSCTGVFREIFKKEPPIGYKWGFVLFGGKKYSKSKGIGMGVTELLQLVPPSVLAYALIRPDLEENRDLNPTSENLLRLLEDYQYAAAMNSRMGGKNEKGGKESSAAAGKSAAPADGANPDENPITRSDRKKALAFGLASSEPVWSIQFSDLLIYHVLYKNWDDVAKRLGNAHDVSRLAPYAENWEKMKLIPQDYYFTFTPSAPHSEAAKEFFQSLSKTQSSLDIHNMVFATAKAAGVKPGELFTELYACIIGQPKGPKLGKLIEAIGIEKVKSSVLRQ